MSFCTIFSYGVGPFLNPGIQL